MYQSCQRLPTGGGEPERLAVEFKLLKIFEEKTSAKAEEQLRTRVWCPGAESNHRHTRCGSFPESNIELPISDEREGFELAVSPNHHAGRNEGSHQILKRADLRHRRIGGRDDTDAHFADGGLVAKTARSHELGGRRQQPYDNFCVSARRYALVDGAHGGVFDDQPVPGLALEFAYGLLEHGLHRGRREQTNFVTPSSCRGNSADANNQ